MEDLPIDKSRLEQSKEESSDGEKVTGRYQVLLPDGRIQTVTYTVTKKEGYKAQVSYSQTGWKFNQEDVAATIPLDLEAFRPSFVNSKPQRLSAPPPVVTTTSTTTTTTPPPTTTTTTTTTTPPPSTTVQVESLRTAGRSRMRLRTWEEAVRVRPTASMTDSTMTEPLVQQQAVTGSSKKKMKTTWTLDRHSEFNVA